jgi:dihydroorotase
MNNTEKITLINGVYKQEDAKEILMTVFNEKVKFHELKQFSMKVCFGKEDEAINNRVLELKESMNKIEAIILAAKAENKFIKIQAEVNISFCDDI